MEIQLNPRNIYNIFLIGVGGTGSNLLPSLIRLLLYFYENNLILVDGDYVEEHNLRNQLFKKKHIGKSKAEVLATICSKNYEKINIRYYDQYIKDENALLDIVYNNVGNDYIPIIVGCVDNNSTRKIIDKVFYHKNMRECIYLDSGNGTNDRVGQVVIGYRKDELVKGSNGYHNDIQKIYLPPIADVYPKIREDNDDINKVLSCGYIDDKNPQNIATNVMAATNLFCLLTNIIAYNKINTHITYFDADLCKIISREYGGEI